MSQVEEVSSRRPVILEPVGPARPRINRGWLGIILCALAGASYGGQAIVAKLAYAEGVNVTTLLTMRFVMGGIAIWLIVAVVKPDLRLAPRKMAGLGVLGLLFISNAGLYYLSLNMLGAGTGALLGNTFPIWVVLWSVLFFKEKMDRGRILALGLAVLGCGLTVDPLAVVASGEKFSWLGGVLAISSSFSNAIYIILSNKFGKGIQGLVIAAWSIPVTATAYILWCVVSGQFQWDMTPLGWLFCIGIGVATGLAIGIYQAGIQMVGSSRAAITATTEPATAVLLAILLLNEPASLIKLTGGACILAAIVLLSRPSPSPTLAD